MKQHEAIWSRLLQCNLKLLWCSEFGVKISVLPHIYYFFSMYLPFSLTNVITFDIPLPKKIFLQRYTKPHYTQLQKIKVYIKYGRFQKTKSRTHQTKNYVSCHFAQTRYFLNKNINISTTENCVVATMIQKCTFLIHLYDNIFLCTDQSLKI